MQLQTNLCMRNVIAGQRHTATFTRNYFNKFRIESPQSFTRIPNPNNNSGKKIWFTIGESTRLVRSQRSVHRRTKSQFSCATRLNNRKIPYYALSIYVPGNLRPLLRSTVHAHDSPLILNLEFLNRIFSFFKAAASKINKEIATFVANAEFRFVPFTSVLLRHSLKRNALCRDPDLRPLTQQVTST